MNGLVHLVVGGQRSSARLFDLIAFPGLSNLHAAPESVNPTTGTYRVLFSFNVDPNGLPSEAVFRYGLTTNYGGTFLSSGLLASQTLQFAVADLVPGFAYHWRVVATNATGATVSPDQFLAIPSSRIAGDADGDGTVSESELGAVLTNYWSASPWPSIENASRHAGLLSFELDSPTAQGFSVEYTTDHVTWTYLTNTTPAQLFLDAGGSTQRAYRLRWP